MRSSTKSAAAIVLALALGAATGWSVLALGGHTDGAGRMGLALGVAVFALVATGWARGRRGWLQGAAVAASLAAIMFLHFLSRGHQLPGL